MSRNLSIEISLTQKSLTFNDRATSFTFSASLASGCPETPTPTGKFQSGRWIVDKTNPQYGKEPWSRDVWGNPYGPYFLEICDQSGRYTSLGIHGTRGYGFSPLVVPPVPEKLLTWFIRDSNREAAKYLYCSHGCIRVSNVAVTTLFEKTLVSTRVPGAISIEISP